MAEEFELSPEEIKVFLEETEELLQLLENDLLQLEKDGTAGDGNLLQEIFRAAHTLKGSSGAVGHQEMAGLTHAMEDIFDRVRKGELAIGSSLLDLLFEALDLLTRYKEDIAAGRTDAPSSADLLVRLKSWREEGASVLPAAPQLDPKVLRELQLRSGELTPVIVRVLIDPSCPMVSVRAFQVIMLLEERGEIVGAAPSREDIEQDHMEGNQITAALLTDIEPEELRTAVAQVSDILAVTVEIPTIAGAPAPAAVTPVAPAEVSVPAPRPAPPPAPAAEGGLRVARRTIRVETDLLDNLLNLVGELVIDRTRLAQVLNRVTEIPGSEEASDDLSSTSGHIARITNLLQEEIMKARMIPVDTLFKKFPRMVRELAIKSGKDLDFQIEGQETELDRAVIDEIGDPLIHLLRNAVDHGLESPAERQAAGKPSTGVVRLTARHEENHILIVVEDDGQGIDPQKVRSAAVEKGLVAPDAAEHLSDEEAVHLIFLPGLSTAAAVSEVSGRGVGMDVVKNNIGKLGGRIDVTTQPGQGSAFRIRLPLTLAIVRALLVTLGDVIYAIPLSVITEAIRLSDASLHTVNQRPVIRVRERVLPLLDLGTSFNLRTLERPMRPFAILIRVGKDQFGIAVDSLIGEQEVVIKGLGKYVGDLPGISGATILGDGSVALILDMGSLARLAS